MAAMADVADAGKKGGPLDKENGDRESNTDFVVAVPSKGRQKSIASKTLGLLLESVPAERIFVFAAPAEVGSYREAVGPLGVAVVEGSEGICAQRNAIMAHFPPGSRVVECDDDLTSLQAVDCLNVFTKGVKAHSVPRKNVAEVLKLLFEEAQKRDCELWGVAMHQNTYYMSRKFLVGLPFVTGQINGYWVPAPPLVLTLQVMEDMERCFELHRRGVKVMRADFLCVQTINRAAGGVLASQGSNAARVKAEDSAKLALEQRYGDLVHSFVKGKTGGWHPRSATKLVTREDFELTESLRELFGLNQPAELRAPASPQPARPQAEEPSPLRPGQQAMKRPASSPVSLLKRRRKSPLPALGEGLPPISNVVQSKLNSGMRRVHVVKASSTAKPQEKEVLEARFAAFEDFAGKVRWYCLACGWCVDSWGPQRMLEHVQRQAKAPRRHTAVCPFVDLALN